MNVAAGWLSAALWRRLRRCYSVLLMLAIWEGAARSGLVNPFLLPAASDVLANLWRMVREGQLLYHTFESLMRASAGLGLALAIGIPLGLIRARSRLANSILDPILAFWFPVPKVGLIPIALLFFGLGHGSKIALVFVDALLPLVIASYQGAVCIDDRLVWSARSMGDFELRNSLPRGIARRIAANPYRIPACCHGIAPGGVSCRDGGFELWAGPRHDLCPAHARNQRRILDADRDVARGLQCRRAGACPAPPPSCLVRINSGPMLSTADARPRIVWA